MAWDGMLPKHLGLIEKHVGIDIWIISLERKEANAYKNKKGMEECTNNTPYT